MKIKRNWYSRYPNLPSIKFISRELSVDSTFISRSLCTFYPEKSEEKMKGKYTSEMYMKCLIRCSVKPRAILKIHRNLGSPWQPVTLAARYRRSLYTVIFISVSELGRRLNDNNLTAASAYRDRSGLITDESYRRPGRQF